MSVQYFDLLANFNKFSNAKMNKIIETISEEEWNKNFPGFYKSIHELCSHTYISDYNWLKRYKALRVFNCLADGFLGKDYQFTDVIFSNKNEYFKMRGELDEKISALIAEMTAADLESILHFTNSKGMSFEKRMDGLLIHLFNHETHHRAMISLYLEMLGKENDYNNVLPYVYRDNAGA